ncbi:plasmid maintenance system antidote protein VapI [Bradyrhizobium sp. AZCC 1719]|uniref:hypothetical protein n=1 Tax=Bradyrhizobium sp. AZCC 1719 TaxID=3117028 RepID=UPI002FF11B7D
MAMPIEEVHRLLDLVEYAQRRIDRLPTGNVQVVQLPELCEAIIELDGWDNNPLSSRLSINASILNKFMKMRGVITKNAAARVADRVRSHLKSEDQGYPEDQLPQDQDSPPPTPAKSKPFTFVGESWVAVDLSSEMKTKITIVATMLDSIIEHARHSNLPLEEQALTELERAQLVVILETALAVLKSPMVEVGLLKKARSALEAGAIKATEKGTQEGLGQVMGIAKNRLAELIAYIFT